MAATESSCEKLNVVVVGGGNSTAIFAALAASVGHSVSIWTRRPKDWAKDLVVGFDNDDREWMDVVHFEHKVDRITDDPSECIPDADLIFLAGLPIHHNPEVLSKIRPHLATNRKVMIGSVCAYGGFHWVAARVLGPGNYVLFGTQLIPWCCSTIEYGKKGLVIGAKRFLRIATEDGVDKDGVKAALTPILRQELRDTDFLTSAFWPNNPWLHPPILYGLFKDWDGTSSFDPETLPRKIYADLRTGSAEACVGLDNDLNAVTDKLAKIYPDNVHLQSNFRMKDCIIENYREQVRNKWDIVTCIMTNNAFSKHYIPYETTPEGNIKPVLMHKFFETDLPYGLITFKDIALMIGVETPTLDALIEWNQKLIHKDYMVDGKLTGADLDECIVPSRMGLTSTTLLEGNRRTDGQPGTPAIFERATKRVKT